MGAESGVAIHPDGDNYIMSFWVALPELDPEGLNYSRNVVKITADAGTDPATPLNKQTGIWMRGVGSFAGGAGSDVTLVSSHGITCTGGIGYQIGQILGGTIQATGVFSTLFSSSDPNTTIVGVYARSLGNGTSKRYAIFADGNTYTQGKVIAEGFAISKDNVYHPSNVATQTLPQNYNLFINDLSSQNQQWNLPDPAAYQAWESIELVNCNSYGVSIRTQPGDYLNTSAWDAKRLALDFSGACATLRSDGINHWYVVSLQGGVGN